MRKDVLLIGIGQTGCAVCELFLNKMNTDGLRARAIAIDTDEETLKNIRVAKAVPMTDSRTLSAVVDEIGSETVRKWFPCDYSDDCTDFVKPLRMNSGSNQWRMKAYLAFASFISKREDDLRAALDEAVEGFEEGQELEIFTVASLAGGTGSGLFLPVSLYVKHYFESKGINIARSRAILTMPDIYKHCYTAEQGVKSYANAYAALSEYNALKTCTCSAEMAEKGEKHPPVSFGLGEDGGIPQMLFSSEKEEYKTVAADPFESVYLFSRVPGVSSVGEHVEIISDILVSLNKIGEKAASDNEKKKIHDASYGGISLVSVKYPIESIVNYISQKQLKDLFADEITFLHGKTVRELDRRRGEAKLYGRQFVETVEQYADALVETAERIFDESGSELSLIGRDPKEFEKDISGEGVFELDYLSDLSKFINDTIECEASREIENIIAHPYPDSDEDGEEEGEKKKKKAKKKKISAKQMRAETSQTAKRCGELLTQAYRYGLRKSIEEKEAFAKTLVAKDAGEGEFSFVDKILKRNGRYLHPAYALMRLCSVRKELASICGDMAYDEAEEPASDEAELSDNMILIREIGTSKSKYLRAGEERFKKLIFDDSGAFLKLADDRNEFIKDLGAVFASMTMKLRSFCYSTALRTIDGLVERYREFISIMYGMADELASDEKLALIASGGANGSVVNVGASCPEKTDIYEKYIKNYKEDPKAVGDYSARIGEKVYEAIFGRDPEESARGSVLSTLETAQKTFELQCENSEFYRVELDRNILEVILASSKRSDSGITLSKVLCGRPVPLKLVIPEEHNEYSRIENRIVAIFDREIEEYLKGADALRGAREPKEYLDSLMYASGEYLGLAEFADNIGRRCIQLRNEALNLRLCFVEDVNETVNGEAFRCAQKAEMFRTEYQTQMWNPYLVYERGKTERLPFIAPAARKEYERDVCRAVIYALANGDLRKTEIDGEQVYAIFKGTEAEPLMLGESAVLANDPASMMLWAYRHPEWVALVAKDFREAEESERRHMPSGGFEGSNIRTVNMAINASFLLGAIKELALPLASDIWSKDSEDSSGFAQMLAELAYSVINGHCRTVYPDTDECFIAIYNAQVEKVAAIFEELLGRDSAQNIFGRLGRSGCFGYYNEMGVCVDYDFERSDEQNRDLAQEI